MNDAFNSDDFCVDIGLDRQNSGSSLDNTYILSPNNHILSTPTSSLNQTMGAAHVELLVTDVTIIPKLSSEEESISAPQLSP